MAKLFNDIFKKITVVTFTLTSFIISFSIIQQIKIEYTYKNMFDIMKLNIYLIDCVIDFFLYCLFSHLLMAKVYIHKQRINTFTVQKENILKNRSTFQNYTTSFTNFENKKLFCCTFSIIKIQNS